MAHTRLPQGIGSTRQSKTLSATLGAPSADARICTWSSGHVASTSVTPRSQPFLHPHHLLSAVQVYYDDLHSFDPATMTWTLLSAANDTRRPSARSGHGFTSAGGLLYVHAGYSFNRGDGNFVDWGYGSGIEGDTGANTG